MTESEIQEAFALAKEARFHSNSEGDYWLVTATELVRLISLARESYRKDAELFRRALDKGLITIHSEVMVTGNEGTRCSWIQGHDKAADISNTAAMSEQEKP